MKATQLASPENWLAGGGAPFMVVYEMKVKTCLYVNVSKGGACPPPIACPGAMSEARSRAVLVGFGRFWPSDNFCCHCSPYAWASDVGSIYITKRAHKNEDRKCGSSDTTASLKPSCFYSLDDTGYTADSSRRCGGCCACVCTCTSHGLVQQQACWFFLLLFQQLWWIDLQFPHSLLFL